jgi:uracil-DNA glycosylase
MISVAAGYDFDTWREAARGLVLQGAAPHEVLWNEDGASSDLFASGDVVVKAPADGTVAANSEFIALACKAILHSDTQRHALLYRLLWRMQKVRGVMRDTADPDVRRLQLLASEVRRDIHKMRAFVRFNPVRDPDGSERYLAWFEPSHHIVEDNAKFFIERFHTMRWSILTPDVSLHWDGKALQTGPGGERPPADKDDPFEDLWLRYYSSIFNPVRLKVSAMTKEMPKKYWHNMPEAALIPGLIAGAQGREAAMVERGAASSDLPVAGSLDQIAQAIQICRACPIGCNGTRAVAGEGLQNASLMIVGEQPGDQEEKAGRPFVGPAGQVLNAHLAQAGINRTKVWMTNAVKHFKHEAEVRQGSKIRLHATPNAGEIDHCRWWLDSERRIIQPQTILALGASAGRAILGRTPSINKERGLPITLADGATLWITAHPSYLLRIPAEKRVEEEARFQDDLRKVAESMSIICIRNELPEV